MEPLDLRETIPALEKGTYLNWGAGGPSPIRVVDTVESSLEHHEYEAPTREGMYPAAFDAYDDARNGVSNLLGASVDEIALTQSTTDGINRVAGALEWDDTDVVVRTDLEHSSGILPWVSPREYESGLVTVAVDDPEATVERLADSGIVVRTLPGLDAVRVSVHAYNTSAEMNAVLEALSA